MVRYSPQSFRTPSSHTKASRRYYLDSMRIPLSSIPRPSTRSSRRRTRRNKAKVTHLAPRYLGLSSLSPSSQRIDKPKQSTVPLSQRTKGSIIGGHSCPVPRYVYVIPLPRPPHQQNSATPLSEFLCKRPNPSSLNSDGHHECEPPQKRHCGGDENGSGLFERASPTSVLSIHLPPFGALPSIPREPETPGNVLDRARKSSCCSALPISTQALTKNFPEKHKRMTPRRITTTSAAWDLNQLDKSNGSMDPTKSLFRSVEDAVVPGKSLDKKEWQECEPPRQGVVSGAKRCLFDGAPIHQNLPRPSKTIPNRKYLVQKSKEVTIRILRLLIFLFACLFGAFIGGVLLYSLPAPESPAAEWELQDHGSLNCSGDEIQTCSLL